MAAEEREERRVELLIRCRFFGIGLELLVLLWCNIGRFFFSCFGEMFFVKMYVIRCQFRGDEHYP